MMIKEKDLQRDSNMYSIHCIPGYIPSPLAILERIIR